MDLRDVRIDTITNMSSIAAMRITHEPTGLSVHGKGPNIPRLRRRLMADLEVKIQEVREVSKRHEIEL